LKGIFKVTPWFPLGRFKTTASSADYFAIFKMREPGLLQEGRNAVTMEKTV
jgi:hypothetical protein